MLFGLRNDFGSDEEFEKVMQEVTSCEACGVTMTADQLDAKLQKLFPLLYQEFLAGRERFDEETEHSELSVRFESSHEETTTVGDIISPELKAKLSETFDHIEVVERESPELAAAKIEHETEEKSPQDNYQDYRLRGGHLSFSKWQAAKKSE